MPDDLLDSFDEFIPGAASKAGLFLQVIQDRAAANDVGLSFVPKQMRKSKQLVLEATVQLGGAILKGAPMKVVVYADEVGGGLQVGWQLTQDGVGGLATLSQGGLNAQLARQARNMKPENQRRLNGMLVAFHRTTFLPVLHQLVDAIEGSQGSGGAGFLGAR